MPFTCHCCGRVTDELPELAAILPDFVAGLEPAAQQRSVTRFGDFLRFDDGEEQHFFVRGLVELPIAGTDETWAYGAWTTLSAKSFDAARPLSEADEAGGPFFGWFANRLAGWEDTLHLKARVHLRPGIRARIELEPTDHPLALAQREGVSSKRIVELLGPALEHDLADAPKGRKRRSR
jgi:hypothetical protein